MNQALKPTSFKEFATLGVEETQDEDSKNVLDEEKKALAYLGNLKGWKILKEYIERMETDLDNMLATTVSSGESFEEIGKKAAVNEIVKNVTRRIKERVANAGEPGDK
jgi:hypothetical protein